LILILGTDICSLNFVWGAKKCIFLCALLTLVMMGAAVAVVNRLRGVPVVPADEGSVISLTSSQESLLKELHGTGSIDTPQGDVQFNFPPVPTIGTQMDIKVLVSRNAKMHKRFEEAASIVSRAVKNATTEARTVPVADATARVLVREEITERMKQIRTRKQIRLNREGWINEIQQALTIRMRLHEIMNANSSGVLVNKVEPVFIKEARGEVVYMDEDEF
jgi:hypothetical protein